MRLTRVVVIGLSENNTASQPLPGRRCLPLLEQDERILRLQQYYIPNTCHLRHITMSLTQGCRVLCFR